MNRILASALRRQPVYRIELRTSTTQEYAKEIKKKAQMFGPVGEEEIALQKPKPQMPLRLVNLKADQAETKSLSRSLILNKFNKDFFIYPEFTDTKDWRTIQGYAETIRRDIQQLVDSGQISSDGFLSEDAHKVFTKNMIFALAVPKDYGGLGMCQKGLAKVMEELSVDWNTARFVQNALAFSQWLTAYGTQEQKEVYLPLLAKGEMRIAIGFDSPCEVTSAGDSVRLCGQKVRLVGDAMPNLLLLFPKLTQPGISQDSCVMVDLRETHPASTVKFDRQMNTLGLDASFVGTVDLDVIISQSAFLETDMSTAKQLRSELRAFSRLPFASAAVGFAKRVIDDVVQTCNTTQFEQIVDASLAEQATIQQKVAKVTLQTYSLESAVYYLAGLMDEGHPVIMDIEIGLIHSMTIDLLTACIDILVWLQPQTVTTKARMQDVIAIIGQMREVGLDEKIAMCALATWATANHNKSRSMWTRLIKMNANTVNAELPRLRHFIAEHVHPSLQIACQEVEYTMSRVESLLSILLEKDNTDIEDDYHTLYTLSKVMRNNFSMVCCVARASRSHCIGLRNSDDEIAWVTYMATVLARSNWFYLDSLRDIHKFNSWRPWKMNIGKAVLSMKGYKIESPLEKNW